MRRSEYRSIPGIGGTMGAQQHLHDSDFHMQYLRLMSRRVGMSQIVRSLRLVPGFEHLEIHEVLDWIRGKDKRRGHQAYRILAGLEDAKIAERRAKRNRKVLRAVDRVLRNVIKRPGPDAIFRSACMVLQLEVQTLRAEANHDLRMSRRAST